MRKDKFNIKGMSCAACQANITKKIKKLEGVFNVSVNLLSNQMTVEYDENETNSKRITEAVISIGYGAALASSSKDDYLKQNLNSADFPKGMKAGYEKTNVEETNEFRNQWSARIEEGEDEEKSMKKRLILSVVFLIPLMYVAMGHMLGWPMPVIKEGNYDMLAGGLTQMLLAIPIFFINRKFFTSGLKALIKGMPNMDSLVAIGGGAAFLYGVFSIYMTIYGFDYGHKLYFESGAMILTLVTVGKYLESRAKAKTSDALGKLIDLAPTTAIVVRNNEEKRIPAEQIQVDDIVIIKPGDSIPVDGIVTEGKGYVDQAAITGESIPVGKAPGDEIISATINKNGSFKFRASKVGGDTTLAQIIKLVDEAGNSKAPIAKLADKISGIFVPVVMAVALIVTVLWVVLGYGFEFALNCGISVLVISCPCALGLATPVAVMVGTGKAAELGILIKSAESLEKIHEIDTVVMDKTGTITLGKPAVTDIVVLEEAENVKMNKNDEDEKGNKEEIFLSLAASIEAGSEHPLAVAIVDEARKRNINFEVTKDFQAVPGAGVTAFIRGKKYYAGNIDFITENEIIPKDDFPKEKNLLGERLKTFAGQGKTPMIFAKGDKVIGIIAVADTVRESSANALKGFHRLGLKTVMLTGDNKITAEYIQKQLAIEEVVAGVRPGEKTSFIGKLQKEGRKVAMVGDGINDAPALMAAHVGIAIGAGTDIAIDSADVVLLKNSLEDVVTSVELSGAVVRNIRMNLFWAFFYNILGIPIAAGALYIATGLLLNPMIGAAAMSLSSLCVVTNALRLKAFKSNGNKKKTQNTDTEKGRKEMKKEIKIEGMMCAHCQGNVEKTLRRIDGVKEVQVDLEKGTATVTITNEISDETFIDAISKAGYTPVNIETILN